MGILAASIAFLFLAQFATAIPPGEPPVEPTLPPPPPRPPDEDGWLCLDGYELRASGTYTFDLHATNASWVIARVDGCDAADITVKKGAEVLQRFTAYPGTILCEPIWFTNETWPDGHPVEGASARYTIEIESTQAQYYSMLAVLPQVLAQGNATLNKTGWYEVPFLAAGRVYCLFDSNFSVTDFSAQVLLAGGAEPLVLKRDDYPGADQYPMNFSAVAAAVQGNRYLQMSADLPAGRHILQLKGAGTAEWAILTDGDNDLDGLDDVMEVQQDLDLAVPDVWGYRTVTGATGTLQDLSDALAAGNYASLAPSWQYVTLNLYIPVAVGAIPLHVVAENGHFENFSIDGDPLACWNMTLDGFQGTGDNLVQFWDNECNWRTAPEWQFTYPDSRFLANLGQGTHAISFAQRENPLDPPRISFFSPLYPITELGEQRAGNPAVDSDLDGLDDGMDREPLDALQWHPGTALRLAVPYTYEDRQDEADLQVTLSVATPEHDYTTRAAPVTWHVGEGQDGTGVKCHVMPVVRCYGLGPTGRTDYWYASETWEQFWGKSVVTQSLVGVDAGGNPYNAAATGLGFLPNPTNETKDPDQDDPANGYYYFMYPEQANKSWAYTVRLPSDHPLLQNRSGILSLTFDFAWQVLEENPNNGTLSLAHIYDCFDIVTIQSAVATYVATAGPGGLRYILGKPTSHAEYVALQALAANPRCEVIQPAGARPLEQSIVKAEQGVGLLPKYHYDKNNLATLSVADRIAHWREVYPRNPGESEVVFYCGKEKTILLLQELAAGVQYDCHADPATVPGGEIQYADVPATWSFGGLADETRAYNIDNDWDGGPWDGSENAQVITRARHFRKVLQLHPYRSFPLPTDQDPAWASVDAGVPANNASMEFWMVLGHKANEYAPDGILDIKIADWWGNVGPWLRFHGERMEYGSRNPATGETTFKVLDDVAVWPDEPIRVSLWYNCTNGTFYIDLGGAAYNLQNFVPFYDPVNKPTALQKVTFWAAYEDACVDAVGLTQAPRGTGDCGGAAYNRSNNAVDYAAWHAGDEERLVAWTQISNTSQGEIPPEQLQGDYTVLWEKEYREIIHAHEEIAFQDLPLRVRVTRASDKDDDGFEFTNYVEITTARGRTQVNNVPQSINDVQAGNIADEEIYYNHQVINERVTSNPPDETPLVQFDDALDTYFEREEYRQTEVDWWEPFYRPGSMRLSDLVKMKIEEIIDQIFETLWQEVRKPLSVRIQDMVNHMFNVEKLAQAACAAAGVPYLAPTWTWDIVLPGNGFWFAPGFYNLDVQNGQLTGSIFNQLGVAVRRPSTDPGTFWVQASQLGPGQIVHLSKNRIAFRRTITLENLPDIVTRVTNAMDNIDKCHLAQLKGESVPFLTWAKLKDKFEGIQLDIWQNIKQQITPILKEGKLSVEKFLALDILKDNHITSVEQLFEPTRITGKMQEGLAPYPEFALVLPVKITRALFAKVNKAAAWAKEPTEIVASYPGNINQLHIGDFAHIPPGTPKDGANLASGINWGPRAVLPDHVLVELWKAWGPDAVAIERVLGFLELCIDGTKDKHGNILQPGYADIPLPLSGTPTRGAFMASIPAGYWPGMTMLDQWRILTGKTGFNDVLAGYFGASKRLTEYVNVDENLLCQRALWYNLDAFGSDKNPTRVRNPAGEAITTNIADDPLYQEWFGVNKRYRFSTPRNERVLNAWQHRVDFFQELYFGAGGDSLSPAEFELVARDIARTLVEDNSLGLQRDAAGNINFLKYVRNPDVHTMLYLMEHGWYGNQPNRVDRILSLKQIFGGDYASSLIARGKELVPSFAGVVKKVIAKMLENTRDWMGAWPGGTEMVGSEFLSIQYSLTDFNLEMLSDLWRTSPIFPWDLYYEFLETTYGPGLNSKPKPILGGGLPMYQVMEFPSETSVIRYSLSMGWDFDTTYGVLTQWRMAQMHAYAAVPALPSAGSASMVMLLEHGLESLQDDLLALEVGKAAQTFAIMDPLGPDPVQQYLGAMSQMAYWQAYLAGKVPIATIFEYSYVKTTMGQEFTKAYYIAKPLLTIVNSLPTCKSIWSSRGFTFLARFGLPLLLQTLLSLHSMQTEVAERITSGQPGSSAWWDVAVKYLVPVLLTTLLDATLVNGIVTATGLGAAAAIGTSFWSGVAASAVTMGLSMFVGLIVSLEWTMFNLIWEQHAADVLTELYFSNALEWVFPAETNASIAKHGGLEAGDVIGLKTMVENLGNRKYRDLGFWNYYPQDEDSPNEGSAFCYRASYSIQGASCSAGWQGCWDDSQRLYPQRDYYDWLGNYEKSYPRSPTDVKTYYFTFTGACASPVLTCDFQVATEFHTRTEHDAQPNSQPLIGFNVMERTIAEFMARATSTQSSKTPSELQAECARAQREFRWKDATQAAQQASETASAQPLVTEAEFQDLLARRVELGVPGAPQGFYTSNGNWQNFTAEEQKAFALLACMGPAEFTKFFPAPGTTDAMRFVQQGFRAAAPEWSMLDSTTILEEEFASTSLSLLRQRGWVLSENPKPTIYAELDGRKGVLSISDYSSDRMCYLAHPLQDMTCGEIVWDFRSHQTADKGPVYLNLATDLGSAINLYIDYKTLYCNGLTLGTVESSNWVSLRVTWDCFAGTCAVWANGQLLRAGIALSKTHPVTGITFYTDVADWAAANIDYVRISGEGGFLGAQRLGYFNTQTPGIILIPKVWFNQTQLAFADKNQSRDLLASLPLQTNIATVPSWGDPFITLMPGKASSVSLIFVVDGPDNPLVSVDLIAPPGITTTFTPRVGFLQDLQSIDFTLQADPGTYTGATYLILNVSCNGNVTAYQRVIPVRLAYEESSSLAVYQGSVLVEPGSGFRWASLYNNGTVPQGYVTTFAGLPSGWLHSDAYVPIVASTFDTGLGGWAAACTSGINLEAKVHAYAGNLVMETPQQAEQLSATLQLPAPIEVRPGDMVRVSLRGTCAGGLSLAAGWSFQALAPGIILTGYKDVELVYSDFTTVSNLTLTGVFNPGEAIWVDAIVLEACTTRHAHEVWQQFSDSTATLHDYRWNVTFASGTGDISAWGPVTNLAYTSAADPVTNYGTATTFLVGPGYNTFIQLPEVPAALLSYANFSSVGQYLYVLHDPAFITESTNLSAWATGAFNETTSGPFPGVTWITQPSFTHLLATYPTSTSVDPTWMRIDASGRTWIGFNATAPHRFWSDDAGNPDSQPAVRFTIPRSGVTGGYLVVQSDVADAFTLTLDLGKNITLNAGDAIRLGFNVSSAVPLNLTAGEFFAINPTASGHYEMVLPITTTVANIANLTLAGALPAGGSFNLDFLEVYHVQPFGDALGDITLGGIYNDTTPLDTIKGYSPVIACTFAGTTDGFEGTCLSGLPACTAVNGSLFINSSSPSRENLAVRKAINAQLPAGTRIRVRASLNATVEGNLTIMGASLNHEEVIPITGTGSWREVEWTWPEGGLVTWITLEACLAAGEYLAVDYLLLEQPALAHPVPYAAGRQDVLPLKLAEGYLSAAEITFGGPRAGGIWEGWIYLPFIGAEIGLAFFDSQRRKACQLTVNNTHLVATNGTGMAVTTGDFSYFQHVQVAWDTAQGNWSVKINNITTFLANYTDGSGILSLAPDVTPPAMVQLDIADAGTYYLDGVQCSWLANYTGSFAQLFTNGSGLAYWLVPGERRVFYVTPTEQLSDQSFLALFADAFTGQIRGAYDGTVISRPSYNIGLSPLSPVTQYCVVGTQASFSIQVTNEGTLADTYNLWVGNYGEASLSLTPTSVSLAPGESTRVKLVVTPGTTDVNYLTVQVSSSRNNTAVHLWVVADDVYFTAIPSGVSYIVGTTGNTFQWTAQAAYVENPTCDVVQNGIVKASGLPWASGVPVSVGIDGLPVGAHMITLSLFTGFGNDAITRTVQVSVFSLSGEVQDLICPDVGPVSGVGNSTDYRLRLSFHCTAMDAGGSGLEWLRVYYRGSTQAWDDARFVEFEGDFASIPAETLSPGIAYYYVEAKDYRGNYAYRCAGSNGSQQMYESVLSSAPGEAQASAFLVNLTARSFDYLPPEIGIPSITTPDIAAGHDQVITCPISDFGGSSLAWARVYYRSGAQAWEATRFVPLCGGTAILPGNLWATIDAIEYYVGASDNADNAVYRGLAGLMISENVTQAHPYSFTVGSCVPVFYKSRFQITSPARLMPRELGDDFTYNLTLQNVCNTTQVYEITTSSLMPHATPTFNASGEDLGLPSIQVSLESEQIFDFSLVLSSLEPCLCDFSLTTTSLTSGDSYTIPAAYFINRPPVVTPPGDITYEQGSTGHDLTWATTDTSPVPDDLNYWGNPRNWYGIYSNTTSATPNLGGYWGTYAFDAPPFYTLPAGWSSDLYVAQVNSGRLYVHGGVSHEEYSNAWLPFGDQTQGTVEWYMYPQYGMTEVGLFRDGLPIAVVRGGNVEGYWIYQSFNDITMPSYNYDYMSLTFDALGGSFSIHAHYSSSPDVSFDCSNIAFANNLVPNEFRVRVIGHGLGYIMGSTYEYPGQGSIDCLGYSWDPAYRVGDNKRVRLVETGTYDPAGDLLTYNTDGLMADPAVGMRDYKYIFIASDGFNATSGDIRTVRVLTPNPVVVPVTGDIGYEYGTTGHSVAWQVFDAFAPTPTYEIWSAGAELPGQYCGTESFQDVLTGAIPGGWSRSDPTKIGVVDECAGHISCLQMQSWDESTDSAKFSFPAQPTGTIEWYTYWGASGSLTISIGDSLGSLAEIRVNSYMGRFEIYNTGSDPFWYPHPQSGYSAWHRFAFTFNAVTGQFAFTVFTPGILGWTGGWQPQPYGWAPSRTWAGTFSRQAQGLTYMDFASNYGMYGQLANWSIDSIGLDWDPLYEVGDLVNLDHEMTLVASGTWVSGDIRQISVDGLDVGAHEYTFVAWDGNGASTGKVSTVEVYNVVPVFASVPEDTTFFAGTLAPSLEWTPLDASIRGATYRIIHEDAGEIASGTWASSLPLAWNPSGLPIGEHHIILELNDGLGGLVQNKVEVIVNDQVTFWGTPLDFSYHVGEETFNIQWIVSDQVALNPTYDLYLRGFEGESGFGTLITSGTWSPGIGSSILVNMGGVPVGLYLASMVVSDGLGADATDQVVFFVTPPDMAPLDWLESELVEAGAEVSCGTSSGDVVVDVVFDTAEDTQMAIGIWNAPPQVEGPDFATAGTYFTVDAEKEAAVTFPIYVTVTLPGGFPAGMTESDIAAWLRFLYFDEVSETWVDPHFPIVAIDMIAGTATIEVWHLSTFALGFANGLPPKIDGPGGLSYEYNSTGSQLITWRLADLTVGPNPTYAIFRDGVLIAEGSWNFGAEVVVDASGLPIGTYNLEIIAFDDLGSVASHRVPINVYNIAPVVSAPGDIAYEAGSSGNIITWVAEDISTFNPTYAVTIDAVQVGAGTWSEGMDITIPVDGLMPGAHEVSLTLDDGLDGSVTDQVLVLVTNKEPVITPPPPITYEDGDPRPVAQWLIEDSSVLAGTFDLLRDGTLVASGAWSSGIPVAANVGGLAPGTYSYTLIGRDGYGAVNEATAIVSVLPDDDVDVNIAKLNASATPFNVTVTFDNMDPSGISRVDWVKVNGTGIANFTVKVVDSHWEVSFNHAFPRDGTYSVELQVSDADEDRPDDHASRVFATSANVTGCDPIKSLMEGVLARINQLQVHIDRVDCWVWRALLTFFTGRAEDCMTRALELYLAKNVPAATVRVWVAQCAMHVDDVLVQVGGMIGIIDPELASILDEHVTSIRADLAAIWQLLGTYSG